MPYLTAPPGPIGPGLCAIWLIGLGKISLLADAPAPAQVYVPTVAWRESHAKAQDSYLPSFWTGASYLSSHPPPLPGREKGDATLYERGRSHHDVGW